MATPKGPIGHHSGHRDYLGPHWARRGTIRSITTTGHSVLPMWGMKCGCRQGRQGNIRPHECFISVIEMHAIDVYEQLAAGLSARVDLHILLRRLLAPVMQLSGARAGSVAVVAPESGGLCEIGSLGARSDLDVGEQVLPVPLAWRGRVLGEYRLRLDSEVVLAADAAVFHSTIGTLLGMALHEADLERGSRQTVLADVHDGVAQTLVFAGMRLPLLEQAIAAQDVDKASRYCKELRQAISSAHTNLRAILSQTAAPMDPLGLKHALGSTVQSFQDLTRITLDYEDRAPALRLSASQESQVYLIVQEALANVAKHAGARHAWLKLDQHGDRVDVQLEDDGMGLPELVDPPSPSHWGIGIMRQRAASLGGGIELAGREGGGTRLRLTFTVGAAA